MKHKTCHTSQYALQTLIAEQASAGEIRPDALTHLALELGVTRAHLEGVASFYEFLALQSGGRYRILFSDDAVDRHAGNAALLERLCQQLWVESGHTSEDGLVHVARTSSLGLADQAPSLLVNGRPIPQVDANRIDAIAERIRAQIPIAEWPTEWFVIADHIRRPMRLLGDNSSWQATLHNAARLTPKSLIGLIKAAGLRGRGGAGFSTARKWATSHASAGEPVIVANADEGEPGTFKDRTLLSTQPELIFAGMAVAARATEATQGFLYLRGEYVWMRETLQSALIRVCAHPDWPAGFAVEIHLGAGAYICGEESALIESLEGHRGIPRNRPPYPAEAGYLGRPTVVNNIETLACVAWIAAHGSEAFRAQGTALSPGTVTLSIAGDCAQPGVYEFPYGVSLAEVLNACGAEHTLAVQVGGPSGTLVDADGFLRRLCFEDLPCNGAITLFDRRRDLFEVVRGYSHFFARESCGFCTPCRVGTRLLAKTLDKIAAGHGTQHEVNEILQLENTLRNASHCGLGQSAGRAVATALECYWPAFERRLKSLDFEPAFDLDGALARARQMTGRDDIGAHLHETRE